MEFLWVSISELYRPEGNGHEEERTDRQTDGHYCITPPRPGAYNDCNTRKQICENVLSVTRSMLKHRSRKLRLHWRRKGIPFRRNNCFSNVYINALFTMAADNSAFTVAAFFYVGYSCQTCIGQPFCVRRQIVKSARQFFLSADTKKTSVGSRLTS